MSNLEEYTYPLEEPLSKEEIISDTRILAQTVQNIWPQMNERGYLNYTFGGNIAITLLSRADSLFDIETGIMTPMPYDARSQLSEITRVSQDIDIGVILYEGAPSTFEDDDYLLFRKHIQKNKALSISENIQPDALFDCDEIYAPYQKSAIINIGNETYIITRPDYIAAYKLQSVLDFHLKKPKQFNKEVPYLINIAETLYGSEQVRRSIQLVFKQRNDLELPLYIQSQTLFRHVLDDSVTSNIVKELLTEAIRSMHE